MIDGGYQYHWLTAYDRQRMEGHRLDWPGQPSFFKDYSPCTSYPLSLPETFPDDALLTVLKKVSKSPLVWNRRSLASLLLLTSALTARSTFSEGEIWYRSNASAGALYPLEFYLSFPGADDLPAGLYHYDLRKPALNRLRHDPALKTFATALPTLVISAIFFRTAWKYRERAYRYLLLDTGHALENLTLALKAMGADFEVILDFDDAAINRAVGFDEQREVALATVRLRSSSTFSEHKLILETTDPEPELKTASRVSAREIDYPLLKEIHLVSSASLRRKPGLNQTHPQSELYQGISAWQVIPEDIVLPESTLGYVESLRRRRSKRNFIKSEVPLDLETLHYLLALLAQNVHISSLPLPEIIFLAADVKGLADGLYLFDPAAGRFGCLGDQDRRRAVAVASLDQRWLKRAALQFIFLADLEADQELHGPRSYRYLQIVAGCLGQRLYLGATALGLGCCAVGAFYDRELARTCCLPENFDPLYLLAVGSVAGNR
ncbi:MAG: SagB/ThcOx family dehydrogenase [Pseudomonadota bacterium]|nr:SagB/ThcOx family dehydrogenase [Pseudomonadota bacterium]